MGLDITAFSNAIKVPSDPMSGATFVYAGDFDRMDGQEDGYYLGDPKFSFRAGSYSGYNEWRDWLSETFIGASCDEVWEDPEKFADKPFIELINFSDCEGSIGPKTCAKLAKDFAANAASLPAYSEDDRAPFSYDARVVGLYRQWQKAFEIGADEGFVSFH